MLVFRSVKLRVVRGQIEIKSSRYSSEELTHKHTQIGRIRSSRIDDINPIPTIIGLDKRNPGFS